VSAVDHAGNVAVGVDSGPLAPVANALEDDEVPAGNAAALVEAGAGTLAPLKAGTLARRAERDILDAVSGGGHRSSR